MSPHRPLLFAQCIIVLVVILQLTNHPHSHSALGFTIPSTASSLPASAVSAAANKSVVNSNSNSNAKASAIRTILRYSRKDQDSSSSSSSSSSSNDKSKRPSWWLPSSYLHSKNDQEELDDQDQGSESPSLQPIDKLSPREERLVRWQQDMLRYAQGAELHHLRADIVGMKQSLRWSLASDDLMRIIALKKEIREKEQKDPEVVYRHALAKIANAGCMNSRRKYHTIAKYTKRAIAARRFIPRLNMEGIWLGNFQEGSQLVNVTYSGDTLYAHKVTGSTSDRTKLLFKADLSPPTNSSDAIKAVPLNGSATKKWGADKLERYAGFGHDRKARSTNEEGLVDANLIVFDGYFSFLWIPTRKHVFFSRPNPDLMLHMMRDTISAEDEMQNMRDHLSRCLEKDIDEAILGTYDASDVELSCPPEPFRRIATEADLEAATQERQIVYKDLMIGDVVKKTSSAIVNVKDESFWGFQKWMRNVDDAMNQNGKKEK